MTAIDPGRRPATPALPGLADAATRLTTVKVNLLPTEITVARRGHKVRRIAISAVALLAVVLGGVSFVARAGVGAADADLAAADALSASLRSQQARYSEVVTLQDKVRAAQQRLDQLTAGDLDWAPLLGAVRAALPAGVTLSKIEAAEDSGAAGSVGGALGGTGDTTAGTAAAGTGTAPAGTGVAGTAAGGAADAAAAAAVPVGVLTLTGVAGDPAAVAAFVDALGTVTGLDGVVATGVATLGDATAGVTGYSYGITAVLTTAAALPLGTTATPTGGT